MDAPGSGPNQPSKYAVIAALGLVSILVGSLIIAAVTEGGDGDNKFGTAFGIAVGISLLLVGIGLTIASAATFLTKRD